MPVLSAGAALFGAGGLTGGYVLGRLHEFVRAFRWRRKEKSELERALEDFKRGKSAQSPVAAGILEQYVPRNLDFDDVDGSPGAGWTPSDARGGLPAWTGMTSMERTLSREVTAALESLPDWNFDVLRFSEFPTVSRQPMTTVGMHLLKTTAWGTINEAMLQEDASSAVGDVLKARVGSFFSEIEGMYLDLPYHNNLHACDVMQTINCFFQSPFYATLMHERLAYRFLALIAGAVHSVGHTGQTNGYHVATETDLAVTYNDVTPLENFHVASAFQLMRRRPQTDWLNVFKEKCFDPRTGQQRSLRSRLRRGLINMVLATDSARHKERTLKFRQWIASGRYHQDMHTSEDMQMFSLEIALQAANLSSSTKRPSIAIPWASRLLEEYWLQGDLERQQFGVISQPFLDRSKANVPDTQIGYMKYVVAQLYEPLAGVMPDSFALYLYQMNKNKDYWVLRKQKGLLQLPTPSEYPADTLF